MSFSVVSGYIQEGMSPSRVTVPTINPNTTPFYRRKHSRWNSIFTSTLQKPVLMYRPGHFIYPYQDFKIPGQNFFYFLKIIYIPTNYPYWVSMVTFSIMYKLLCRTIACSVLRNVPVVPTWNRSFKWYSTFQSRSLHAKSNMADIRTIATASFHFYPFVMMMIRIW